MAIGDLTPAHWLVVHNRIRGVGFSLMFLALFTGGCEQKEVYIPQEGDVVTWKHKPELIIKARLGQRREHVPADPRTDHRFYEPQYERFIGQFPIDYEPEPFPRFTEEELAAFLAEHASKTPSPKSGHPLEFSLMLNGVKAVATDRSIYSSEALDDINQVKVVLGSPRSNSTTKDSQERFLRSEKPRYDKQSSDEYGLDCYHRTRGSGAVCMGSSNNPHGSGVTISVMNDNWVRGQSWEPIYGGIHVHWRIHRQNLKHWKKVDAAIWRMLERWNISPLVTPNSTTR